MTTKNEQITELKEAIAQERVLLDAEIDRISTFTVEQIEHAISETASLMARLDDALAVFKVALARRRERLAPNN